MKKINGMIVFKAQVTSVEFDRVHLSLEDGCEGLMFFYELPGFNADMSYIFSAGQSVYVRKKQALFTGIFLVTMNGLLNEGNIENMSDKEWYSVTCKELHQGTLIQITPNMQICLYGIFLPRNTKIVVMIRKCRDGKIRTYLSSVIYDDYITEPIFYLDYKNVEEYEESQVA